jgi:plastocyanin
VANPRPVIGLSIAVAVALGLGLAACSSSGSGGAGSSAVPVATAVVDLPPSYRFAPEAISVAAGTTVTWTNHDNFTHSVQFLDGGLPTEPLQMQPGASTTFAFATPGTYAYQCHLHPQDMRGTVTVTP